MKSWIILAQNAKRTDRSTSDLCFCVHLSAAGCLEKSAENSYLMFVCSVVLNLLRISFNIIRCESE